MTQVTAGLLIASVVFVLAGAAAQAQSSQSAPAQRSPIATYRTGEWSRWTRAQGVEFRYRWGLDPRDKTNVDALYQVKNVQTRAWEGAVRSLDCSTDQLSRSSRVVLNPNETKDVKFRTPNCGTADQPSFRPNVVRSGRID